MSKYGDTIEIHSAGHPSLRRLLSKQNGWIGEVHKAQAPRIASCYNALAGIEFKNPEDVRAVILAAKAFDDAYHGYTSTIERDSLVRRLCAAISNLKIEE